MHVYCGKVLILHWNDITAFEVKYEKLKMYTLNSKAATKLEKQKVIANDLTRNKRKSEKWCINPTEDYTREKWEWITGGTNTQATGW